MQFPHLLTESLFLGHNLTCSHLQFFFVNVFFDVLRSTQRVLTTLHAKPLAT